MVEAWKGVVYHFQESLKTQLKRGRLECVVGLIRTILVEWRTLCRLPFSFPSSVVFCFF